MGELRLIDKLLLHYEHEMLDTLMVKLDDYKMKRDDHRKAANSHSNWIIPLAVLATFALTGLITKYGIAVYLITVYGILLLPIVIILYHYLKGKNASLHCNVIETVLESRSEGSNSFEAG